MFVQWRIRTRAHNSVLTGGVAFPRPSWLVPDRQAVLQKAEMALFLPRTGLDFSQSRPCHHHLDIWVILDTCTKSHKKLMFMKETKRFWSCWSSVWENNIYSHEPSGSIAILESYQWKCAAKKADVKKLFQMSFPVSQKK